MEKRLYTYCDGCGTASVLRLSEEEARTIKWFIYNFGGDDASLLEVEDDGIQEVS